MLGGLGFAGKVMILDKRAKAGAEATPPPKAAEADAAEEEEEEEEEASKGGGHGEGAGGPLVMVYKNVVNLEGAKRNAYLKVEFNILFRDQELGKAATSDKATPENAKIRALLLDKLTGKSLEEVTDADAREDLRVEILEALNEAFAPKPPKPGTKEDPKHKKPKKPVKDVLIVDWATAQ